MAEKDESVRDRHHKRKRTSRKQKGGNGARIQETKSVIEKKKKRLLEMLEKNTNYYRSFFKNGICSNLTREANEKRSRTMGIKRVPFV